MVQTFIAVLLGAVSFGGVGPIIGAIVAARTAAAELYAVIDAVPEVDVDLPGHKAPVQGRIEFVNCTFSYPSRPDQVMIAPCLALQSQRALHLDMLASVQSHFLQACARAHATCLTICAHPLQVILKNFSLVIEPGTTVALVGPSGSGKSTIIALLERFYECREGKVLVDGIQVKDWDLKGLRNQIGLVQQDPLLFGVPI